MLSWYRSSSLKAQMAYYALSYEETDTSMFHVTGSKIYTPGDHSNRISLVKGQLWLYMRHIMSKNSIHCLHWAFISKDNAFYWSYITQAAGPSWCRWKLYIPSNWAYRWLILKSWSKVWIHMDVFDTTHPKLRGFQKNVGQIMTYFV